MNELWTLFSTFFKIGICTFGGGYAMLPMLEREIVNKKQWAAMDDLLNYMAIGQCTPGIIAVNAATFVGHRRRGNIGGIVATLGVVTPSLIIISLIAALLARFMDHPYVGYAFAGIRVAVCAMILRNIVKLAKTNFKKWWQVALAVAAFAAVGLLKVSSPIATLVTIAIGVGVYFLTRGKGEKQA